MRQPRRRAHNTAEDAGERLELRDGLRVSVVEMHVHTTMASSDSMLDPHDLVRIAGENTLTGVNLTEHDQVIEPHQQEAFREEHEDLFVNFGMEVSTDMGHMIAVGLRTYLPGIRRAEHLRAELDQVGGFLVVAHPFRRLFDPVTAMRTGVKFELTAEQAAEQLPVFKHVHAIEVANGANTPQENEFAYEVSQIVGIPGTGGSDAHSVTGIGAFATGFEQAVDSPERFLEELHAGRFEAVHRSNTRRWVKFEAGSSDAAKQDA